MDFLTPRQIVKELDKYIIGQKEAKRAVAIALRNRLRRQKLPPELKDEVAPKNILMIGPTGVGKTEIARRLAKLINAPFVKVEASKYTEVGYVGRDVESMVRDLTEFAVNTVRAERIREVEAKAQELAEERILQILLPSPKPKRARVGAGPEEEIDLEERFTITREKLKRQLKEGLLEERVIEVEVKESALPMVEIFAGAGLEEMEVSLHEILGNILPSKTKRKKVTIAEARRILAHEEMEKLIDMDGVVREAIRRVEELGIIFVDEIDKIAGRESGIGPDVSREGVQRDLLPIVEGTTILTKYGPVKSDHILFIAAGAFHVSKPSDLIPELQGRFPLRVELDSLSKEDFVRILTEPRNALIKQYKALLETEGITVEFTPEAIEEIASIAYQVNEQTENIGARRLHTVMEKVLEDISFNAPEEMERYIVIDGKFVREKLKGIVTNRDLSRYIL